ncbi:ferritin-like domain-containing protein [Fimbriiglobus ruber]|uniref:Protein yciF n=1 Tax=Fimbriiglobus ruber TaxID=1908690 RepID=A0A225DYZ3_9BACT|nr:ferritin-like domain-containing protein [Fimbriiglobus ruber]OWK46561.1 Protein yciF [Fimbriiglobus ruber]
MAAKSMYDLFVNQLQDAYSAETQLLRALPKMAKASHSEDLRAGFEHHLAETRNHVSRLKHVCDQLNCSPSGNACEAMQGLVEEGEEIIGLGLEPEVQDAGLIAAAQKVEHYEMALYGALCAFAKRLGYSDIAVALHETLDEEKKADETLSRIAETQVNHLAVHA